MNRNPENRRSRRSRDAGLRRISRLTRWSLAGALTGTGLFAGLASQAGGATTSAATKAAAAKTSSAKTPSSKTVSTSTAPSKTASTTTTVTAPTVVPATDPAVVVSGAS